MPNPFPGMNPWLESPEVWRDVHARIINAASDLLQPQLREQGFYISIDERIWIEEPERNVYPDLAIIQWAPQRMEPTGTALLPADTPILVRAPIPTEIRERFLQIFDIRGRVLVTQLELISPANKSSQGRELYIQKRNELSAAGVSVVEIDLLRAGEPVIDLPRAALETLLPWSYLVCVKRAWNPQHEVYRATLQDRLPRVRIPLREGLPDAVLDLQAALDRVYDAGAFDVRLDYSTPPKPELSADEARFATEVLQKTAGP